MLDSIPKDLVSLDQLIRGYPQGIKEFELLQVLYAPLEPGQRPNLKEPLVLFQQHFLLFNSLYRLRDALHQAGQGTLLIDALHIQWQPTATESTATRQPDRHDALHDYYLNLDNLTRTGESDVEALLSGFWRHYAGQTVGDDERQRALAVLELPAEATYGQVRQRYRQLLSQHHPDRGGCHETAQQLNEAMVVLKRSFGY